MNPKRPIPDSSHFETISRLTETPARPWGRGSLGSKRSQRHNADSTPPAKHSQSLWADYTGVDPKHVGRKPYAPLCSHWAPQLNRTFQRPRSGAGCSSDPNMSSMNGAAMCAPGSPTCPYASTALEWRRLLLGPKNTVLQCSSHWAAQLDRMHMVCFNGLGMAQAAPRTQTYDTTMCPLGSPT